MEIETSEKSNDAVTKTITIMVKEEHIKELTMTKTIKDEDTNITLSVIDRAQNIYLYNFRDLLSTPTLKDSPWKEKLFRSACVSRSSAITNEQLAGIINFLQDEIMIKTIIDLRDSKERDKDKNDSIIGTIWNTQEFDARHEYVAKNSNESQESKKRYAIPLINQSLKIKGLFFKGSTFKVKMGFLKERITHGEEQATKYFSENVMNEVRLTGLSKLMLEYSAKEIVYILRILNDKSNYPVMIHCSSGKDRTGLICAIVLSICGVDKDEIVENYKISETYLEPVLEMIREEDSSKGLDEHFSRTPPEVMKELLEWVEATYGSMSKYLSNNGFSEVEQKDLKHLLCEDEKN